MMQSVTTSCTFLETRMPKNTSTKVTSPRLAALRATERGELRRGSAAMGGQFWSTGEKIRPNVIAALVDNGWVTNPSVGFEAKQMHLTDAGREALRDAEKV